MGNPVFGQRDSSSIGGDQAPQEVAISVHAFDLGNADRMLFVSSIRSRDICDVSGGFK